ncbi:MAG: family 43 glycosylhydrolase [Porphyromonadaceae bacterium]|nr:family 43 glycosylhydrolase [Porphyromonadaceae bacterium]
MKQTTFFLVLFFSLIIFANDIAAKNYELVWSDEFNYTGAPNPEFWNFENGFVRNNELQWYQKENAYCKNGVLIIEARREKRANPLYDANRPNNWRRNREFIEYTSSSINTKDLKEFKYGRFEIRAKIPLESGAWPAIWTLGRTMEWPSNGEIDIMEYYRIDGVPHILANAAWGTERRYNAKWNSKAVPFANFLKKDKNWGEKFHTWRMDWDENAIKIYLDNELINDIPLSATINGSIGDYQNPFKQPHYLLLNLAIGGQHGGEPDVKAFPMKYEIDYVRVYQTPEQQKGQNAPKEIVTHTSIQPGKLWTDNEGNHINAHGGGLLYDNGKYYWFGEHKGERSNAAHVGVMCYSSKDLMNWTNEGVALAVSEDEKSDIVNGSVIERPKVIYNPKTGKYVMWFHLELKGRGYEAARAGLAVSDNVTGPYTYIESKRINPGIFPFDMPENVRKMTFKREDTEKWWTPTWRRAVENGYLIQRDLQTGQMSRDMTLYVDDDGKAYHIYSSEENLTLHIAELSDDFLSHTGKYVRVAPAGHNEAPAIFKRNGVYWMITSGCTGWDPNEARMFSSNSIWGPWKQHKNPARGEKSEITFGGQSTYIQKVHGKEDAYLFMADMWRPRRPIDGRYIWLPITFENEIPMIEWREEWSPETFWK